MGSPFSRGSSQPRDWTQVSCIAGRFFTSWAIRDCVDHNKLWEMLKETGIRDHLTFSWEICIQVKKQQLEPNMNNGLVPNWERNMLRLYTVTLLIYLICKVYHVKCQAGWSTSCNQDCWRSISNLRYADDTIFMAESGEELKSLLMKMKEESE